MKAFEKWREKNYTSGRSYKQDARVWEACLKWLLTQPLCGYSSDIVKKELENK